VRTLNWYKLSAEKRQLDLRGHVTTAAEAENRFIEDMPGEIKEVLRRYADAQSRAPASQSMADFAGRFLVGMYEDGAVLPTNLSASAPEVLALTLLQHRTSPRNPGAWLNLGFALRRAALYRTEDADDLNRARLHAAVQAFDRSLKLDPDNTGKNVRAWIGKSFTYNMLGLHDQELECCAQALAADKSDPKLWLLYGFALRSAGRKDEALSVMNDAHDAYIKAGRPEELRGVFADIQPATPKPCRQRMA
jgi:tetratricopeptide (TPR) repeat protein